MGGKAELSIDVHRFGGGVDLLTMQGRAWALLNYRGGGQRLWARIHRARINVSSMWFSIGRKCHL